MSDYKQRMIREHRELQERARIEQVDLNAPLEGGESGEVSQD